jgi:hypothetical protein
VRDEKMKGLLHPRQLYQKGPSPKYVPTIVERHSLQITGRDATAFDPAHGRPNALGRDRSGVRLGKLHNLAMTGRAEPAQNAFVELLLQDGEGFRAEARCRFAVRRCESEPGKMRPLL